MNDLFARVRPLVGDVLVGCQVALVGSAAAGDLIDYLAACGVCHWLVVADDDWMDRNVVKLRQRFGPELEINLQEVDSVDGFVGADVALVVDDVEAARTLPIELTRLAIFSPTGDQRCRAVLAMPGEDFDFSSCINAYDDSMDSWEWQTAAPLMALYMRALLLHGTPYAMPSWETAWTRGKGVYVVGAPNDPTCAMWLDSMDNGKSSGPPFRTPIRRHGTLLIAGLGSLGSVAARRLGRYFERMILVDPDHVEVANLARQAYTHEQIGKSKAAALAESLYAESPGLLCDGIVDALTDEAQVTALVVEYGVTVALVTTGTHADFAIARGLRGAGITHVVGRCYARARFWEGIVVDGAHGLSYEQVRRGVAMGPTPLPTNEELAAYGAVGELAADPATAMETGWAALWLARLVTQMAAPVTLREGWLLGRLAAGATCFVGGVVVEPGLELGVNGSAYGIEVPGQVHAWSVAEIA